MAAEIAAVLQLDRGAAILAAAAAQAMGDMGSGGQRAVRGIARPDRAAASMRWGIGRALAQPASPVVQRELAAALDFWRSDLGRRVTALDLAASELLLDPQARTAAVEAFSDAAARSDPRVAAIRLLMERAGLVEPAVAVSLNAGMALRQGLREGGAGPFLTDTEIATQMWRQEPERRAELAGGIEAHLYLAFGPLSDGEVALLTAELARPGQRRLAAVVDRGVEAAWMDLSRAMGRALARQRRGARP